MSRLRPGVSVVFEWSPDHADTPPLPLRSTTDPPSPGDYGDIVSVNGASVTVRWDHGLISQVPRTGLTIIGKRYRVTFSMYGGDQVQYFVSTWGGPPKAVFIASGVFLRADADLRPSAVEVEYVGRCSARDHPDDLLPWDEIS